jgi:hypothetical protein
MDKIIFLTILSLTSAGRIPRSGDHHGDGHDDNCVDISKYGPVQYNESTPEICSYKMKTACTKRSREVCITVPITECHVVGYTHCENTPSTITARDDSMESEQFTQQNCVISSEKKVISEVKKMPVCKNVTKQQCDTKWVINEQGEKVWAGNENCEEVTWEDCTLEDKVVTQEVDVWECTPDTEPIAYQTAIINTVDVTFSDRVCEARANPVCSQTSEVKCKTVEWEDCFDTVTPNCISAHFKIPYQEYDHRLRCSVGH